jgi:phage major head subunit gpT-like protein
MQTIKLPLQRLDAAFAPSEANAENRTVPLVWYAGATVLQFNWQDGLHNLKLSMDPKAVRLKQLNSGRAPFTSGHASANDPTATLGIIQQGSVRLDGDKGRALVRFSKRPDVEPLFQDVLDGVLSNVSVGTRLHRMKEITEKDDKLKTFVALDWEPYAVALVGVGGDPGAHFAAEFSECEVELHDLVVEARASGPKEQPMEQEPIVNTGIEARVVETSLPVVAAADAQLNAAHKVGVTAEQGRITGILRVAKVCGLTMEFAEKHIAANTSLENFRTLAIDEQAAGAARQEVPHVRVDILRDQGDTRRQSMTGALLERFDSGKWEREEYSKSYRFHKEGGQAFFEGARNYASCTLLDIAKECLANQNIRWQNKSRTEIAQLAFQGSSDFPFILADVANKTLRAGYDMAESQWRLIASRRTAADFKDQKELTIDLSSRLAIVPESGEFKRGALVEGKETYKLATYGRIISITRQAIINDDLGAFTRTPQLLGQEVAMLEADTVYGIVKSNVAMRDTFYLFGTEHVNLMGTPAAINVANLGLARVKLMSQTSTGGKTLGIQPRYLLACATISQVAEQYCSANFVASSQANINPLAGRLVPIIEARLDVTDDFGTGSSTAWYLFGDPVQPNATVLIYAYLQGQEGPYTETRNGFDVDGVEIKIRHDFAAAATDWRGAVKNAGA